MTTRVLYAISSLQRGGAERQLVELIRGLDRSRFEPRLAMCDTTDQFGYDLGVGTVIDLKSAEGSTPITFARLIAALRRFRPDVLHTFGGLLNIYGRMATRVTGIGHAVTAVRNGKPPTRDLAHEALTWRMADAIVVNSVGIRDVLMRRSGIPGACIEVVENGVDCERFAPPSPEAREASRVRWKLSGRALVLPARITPEKNHLAVIRALGILRDRGVLPNDVSVHFAGRVAAQSFDAHIRRALMETGTADRVFFEGRVDDIAPLLGAADGVMLASTHEGMPNVVLEAMACGTNVLVTPPANLDALVRDGVEGTVTHGTSAGALVEGIARWCALSAESRVAMGVRGRARAQTYSLATMVERTCAIYDRLTADGGLRARSSKPL